MSGSGPVCGTPGVPWHSLHPACTRIPQMFELCSPGREAIVEATPLSMHPVRLGEGWCRLHGTNSPLVTRPLAHAISYCETCCAGFQARLMHAQNSVIPFLLVPRRLPVLYMRALLCWLSAMR